MYRFERLLNSARQLRLLRSARFRDGRGDENSWQEDWQAGKVLVLELAGRGEVRLTRDGKVRVDERRNGGDDILDLTVIDEFIERGVAALQGLAKELSLEDKIVASAGDRVRRKLSNDVDETAVRFGRAKKEEPETPEQLAARRASYVENFMKTRKSVLRDMAVLTIEAALFDVVREFLESGDKARPVAERDATPTGFEVVNGRLRKKRKPRRGVQRGSANPAPA